MERQQFARIFRNVKLRAFLRYGFELADKQKMGEKEFRIFV
jgi:hypothetical protein